MHNGSELSSLSRKSVQRRKKPHARSTAAQDKPAWRLLAGLLVKYVETLVTELALPVPMMDVG